MRKFDIKDITRRSKRIKHITKEEAYLLLETNDSLGKFFYREGDFYIAINNIAGNPMVKEFLDKRSCKQWLKNGGV